MQKMKLRAVALVLAMVMLVTGTVQASGTENADRLHALGLFQGTATGYALDKSATRLQGLIMLIRLLGEEDLALACETPTPFRDVAEGNPARYTAYAYEKGYTTGTSATTFTPGATLNFKGYVTFLLRALGYDDGAGDFTYADCLSKAAQVQLMTSASAQTIAQRSPTLYRADLVDLSLAALTVCVKGQSTSLAQKLIRGGVFTETQARTQAVLGAGQPYQYVSHDYSTVSRVSNTYAVASGKVSADVVTVNLANSKVSLKTAMVNGRLGATAAFSSIAAASGASVVINGNFFDAYGTSKFPIGHVMANGTFLYGVSGLTSFGFTQSGEIRVGRPAVFFYVEGGGTSWACYECNSKAQGSSLSVVYTPAYGASVAVTAPGVATTVAGGVIQSSRSVAAGESVAIPANGYVMLFGSGFASTSYYRAPKVGTAVTMTPRLTKEDANGFTLDGVENIVSGGPCLVQGGKICTTLEPGFQEARFTTSSTPRTAIGKLSGGKLVIVSTGAATIQQLRELMFQLGCVDAVNLDGGASTALAYGGKVIRAPGRELTTTLQIFIEP